MADGKKTGGRKKGIPNRANAARQEEVAKTGITPLDYILALMRDESKPDDVRFEAAKAAAPYVHPRLAAVQHSGQIDLNHKTDEQLNERLAQLLGKAGVDSDPGGAGQEEAAA